MKLTLLCPLVNKPQVFDIWFESLSNLNLPFKDCQLLIIDGTKRKYVYDKLCSLKSRFGSFTYLPNTFQETDWTASTTDSLDKHYKVAQTYDFACNYIEGELLLILEDDQTVHPNTFQVLLQDLYELNKNSFECFQIVPTLFSRGEGNVTYLWDARHEPLQEKESGIEPISLSSSGVVLTYADTFKAFRRTNQLTYVHGFKVLGPDTTYCFWWNIHSNYSVYVDWSIKTGHYDSKGYSFRQPRCATNIQWNGKIIPYPKPIENINRNKPFLLLRNKSLFRDEDYFPDTFQTFHSASTMIWKDSEFFERLDNISKCIHFNISSDRQYFLLNQPHSLSRISPYIKEKDKLIQSFLFELFTKDPLIKAKNFNNWGVFTEFDHNLWQKYFTFLTSNFNVIFLVDETDKILKSIYNTLPSSANCCLVENDNVQTLRQKLF